MASDDLNKDQNIQSKSGLKANKGGERNSQSKQKKRQIAEELEESSANTEYMEEMHLQMQQQQQQQSQQESRQTKPKIGLKDIIPIKKVPNNKDHMMRMDIVASVSDSNDSITLDNDKQAAFNDSFDQDWMDQSVLLQSLE